MRTLSIICLHFFDIFSSLCVKKKSVNQVHMYLQCIHIFIIQARKHLQSCNLTISLIMVISYPFLFIYLGNTILLCIYQVYRYQQKNTFHQSVQQLIGRALGYESDSPGSNLGGATSSEVCSEVANFFLLIEDYGYSKSRTKIGVSVDIKV